MAAIEGVTLISRAPVAQLDRVAGFEPVGWGFESLRAYDRDAEHPFCEFRLRRNIVGCKCLVWVQSWLQRAYDRDAEHYVSGEGGSDKSWAFWLS